MPGGLVDCGGIPLAAACTLKAGFHEAITPFHATGKAAAGRTMQLPYNSRAFILGSFFSDLEAE
jgi:hypothetical protein